MQEKDYLRMDKRRKFIRQCLIMGLIIICLNNIPFTKKIDISYDGIEWGLGDPEYSEKVSVVMKGKYYRYLFRTKYYEGTLEIKGNAAGSDFDICNDEVRFEFKDTDCRVHNALAYGEYEEKLVHELLWNGSFDTLVFKVYEIMGTSDEILSWDSNTGYVITAPAKDRESAIKATNKVLKSIDLHWKAE
ncbi:MAG: hypothetical protein ACYDEX_07775 [Mobilitalea sp.]